MPLTPAHYAIMRHTLGLDRKAESDRNYFCANDNHDDIQLIMDLVVEGLMKPTCTINQGRNTIYAVTAGGQLALERLSSASSSPPPTPRESARAGS